MSNRIPDNYSAFESHEARMSKLEDGSGFSNAGYDRQHKIDQSCFDAFGGVQLIADLLTGDVQASAEEIKPLVDILAKIEEKHQTRWTASDLLDEILDITHSKVGRPAFKNYLKAVADNWEEKREEMAR